ncbi:MAG: DoxX family protein [Vicingaceae bacterium]
MGLKILQLAVVFTAISFLFYGSNCLISNFLKEEFKRFGLAKFRRLTGILQLFGAIGLLVGLLHPRIGVLASAGLALLMVMGFYTRIRIKDSFKESFPSLLFIFINAFILVGFLHYYF